MLYYCINMHGITTDGKLININISNMWQTSSDFGVRQPPTVQAFICKICAPHLEQLFDFKFL